jgi:hypothetical protein
VAMVFTPVFTHPGTAVGVNSVVNTIATNAT